MNKQELKQLLNDLISQRMTAKAEKGVNEKVLSLGPSVKDILEILPVLLAENNHRLIEEFRNLSREP